MLTFYNSHHGKVTNNIVELIDKEREKYVAFVNLVITFIICALQEKHYGNKQKACRAML